MAWFRKTYDCPCGEHWTDEWSCLCNDRCPSCNKEIEPNDDAEDLSVKVEAWKAVPLGDSQAKIIECKDSEAEKFVVLKSSDDADDEPDYRIVSEHATRADADRAAEKIRAELD